MSIVIQLLSLGLLLAAVVLFVSTAFAAISVRWNRRIASYAAWMNIEFQAMYEDMSLDSAKRVITLCIGGAFVFGFLLGGTIAMRLVLSLVFAFGGYFGPWVLVWYLRRRRLETIDNQLVDTLQLMASALRSGLNLQQSLELVVREMKPPISDEFGRLMKEIHMGRFVDDALRTFAERVPLADVRLMVESVLTLRETGGNLSETFQVIAETIVERKKVDGKIKAMTTQGMTQGIVVCLMPIVMMLLFSFIDPLYMRPFFTTPLGWMMMAVIFALDGAGLWLMLKLVKVDV